MTTKRPASIVDNLLSNLPAAKSKNMICANPDLVEAITHFLHLKARGDEIAKHVTLSWFYDKHLREQFDGPVWFGTVRKFVKEVLKLDHTTGKRL